MSTVKAPMGAQIVAEPATTLFRVGENVCFRMGTKNQEVFLRDSPAISGERLFEGVFSVIRVGPVTRYNHGKIPQMVTIFLNNEEKTWSADWFEHTQ